MINITSPKNMNGKTSPGKAKSEFSPVSIKGTRQEIKYAKMIMRFRENKIIMKSLGLPLLYFFFKAGNVES
jgi:hypothetical protein